MRETLRLTVLTTPQEVKLLEVKDSNTLYKYKET